MADDKNKPAAKAEKAAYRLEVDTLGYIDDDGVRQEVEGRGSVHTDLHPNAVKRGRELNALVKVSAKDAKAAGAPEGSTAAPDFDEMTDEELITNYATISPQVDRSEVEQLIEANRDEVVQYVRDNYAAHP